MEQGKFEKIVNAGQEKLAALMSPAVGVLGGRGIFYNSYLNGLEVVVMGCQFEEDGHTYTKPVAILVDDDLFDYLKVDGESGRVNGEGKEVPAVTVDQDEQPVLSDDERVLANRIGLWCDLIRDGFKQEDPAGPEIDSLLESLITDVRAVALTQGRAEALRDNIP